MINIEDFNLQIIKGQDNTIRLWARFTGSCGVWHNISAHLPPKFNHKDYSDTSRYLRDVLLLNIASFVTKNDHGILNEIQKQIEELKY